MKITLKKRLLDALNACRAIQSFVADRTFAEYEQNLMLRSAVERMINLSPKERKLCQRNYWTLYSNKLIY